MKRCKSLSRSLLLPLLTATTPVFAFANITFNTWIDSSGNWSTDSNWSLGHTPADGEWAQLTQSDSSNRTVTLTGNTAQLSGFSVDSTGTGSMSFNQPANTLSVNGPEYIGSAGSGTINQSSGVNTIGSGTATTGSLILGANTGSTGTYNLFGDAVLQVTRAESIGDRGSGTFNQHGGTNSNNNLYVGYNTVSSVGFYNLFNGTLASADEQISGLFNQSGGTNAAGSLQINGVNHNISYYTLTNGVVSTGVLYVGIEGPGYLIITGGTLSADGMWLSGPSTPNWPALYRYQAVQLTSPRAALSLTVPSESYGLPAVSILPPSQALYWTETRSAQHSH